MQKSFLNLLGGIRTIEGFTPKRKGEANTINSTKYPILYVAANGVIDYAMVPLKFISFKLIQNECYGQSFTQR